LPNTHRGGVDGIAEDRRGAEWTMQRIDELALPVLPLEDPDFASDPWPYLAMARAGHAWLATCSYGYVVHQFGAIKDLLWQDDCLQGAPADIVAIMGAEGTDWGRFQKTSLLARTGAAHQRLRSVLAPAFTPRQANRHRPLMQAVIADLLDEWVPRQEFDFEEFASNFPIGVMCSLIGASRDVIPELRASLEAFGLSFSMEKGHLPALERAMLQLDEFVRGLVAERRRTRLARSEADLLETLLETHERGDLTERELYDLLIFLFVAGFDTSKNALTLMMSVLVDHPAVYERCATDPAYCRRVVEENFRYLTTSTIPRTAVRDLEYRDVSIPAGTVLFFPVSISGRDPSAHANPDSFDPERKDVRKHLTFGLGGHICLGQFIARAQIEEGLHQIAQRMRNPRRTGPSAWRPFFGVWGMKGLPIAFDPAPARHGAAISA
jgi:cytochrome P450